MQRGQRPAQPGEQPATLDALFEVALQPRSPDRRKIVVDVSRYVAGRPPMIQPVARSVKRIAHLHSDPFKRSTGSHTASVDP
jgi:hypothetical protein